MQTPINQQGRDISSNDEHPVDIHIVRCVPRFGRTGQPIATGTPRLASAAAFDRFRRFGPKPDDEHTRGICPDSSEWFCTEWFIPPERDV